MPAYHQIGHHSENLILDSYLSGYRGAILSPVNYTQENTIRTITRIRDNFASYDIVFDPQLYYPRTERANLRGWSYFPNDVDTVDLSSITWWKSLVTAIARTVSEIEPNTVCTPVIHPRNYDNNYYDLTNRISDELCNALANTNIRVLQTAFVSLSVLANYDRVMSIASVLTRTNANGVYLILYSETNPRRELNDPEELKGGMLLIKTLEDNGIEVLVGYTSSDVILWKESGATSCASGKFFNLRRFTSSRWEETSDGGGGQLPYLFEENLLASVRESDIIRLERAGLLSTVTQNSPYYAEIQQNTIKGTPWLSLGWRFYLYWFYDIEQRIEQQTVSPMNLLRNADRIWLSMDTQNIFLDERQNNGDWIRQWLRAISEYETPW